VVVLVVRLMVASLLLVALVAVAVQVVLGM
jgi:hypothetical protein